MLSDGRIIYKSLAKVRCIDCGLIRHLHPPSAAEIDAIYFSGYSLPARIGYPEDGRGLAYANAILDAVGPADRIGSLLDVGCGSGAMLKALARLDGRILLRGVDPALPEQSAPAGGRMTLERSLLSESQVSGDRFDVVTAINTVEHIADPAGFLRSLALRLEPGGRLVIVCPSASPANDELLFFDHLWTITPAAMAKFAMQAELSVMAYRDVAGSTGFQMFVLGGGAEAGCRFDTGHAEDAIDYLNGWSSLDTRLMRELVVHDRPVQAFGAGQMAALLRAYTPEAWSFVERLVVDYPAEAWPIGVVEQYRASEHRNGWATLIAVHPRSQADVAARIVADGGRPVTLPPFMREMAAA